MRAKKYKVYLTESERKQLLKTVKSGTSSANKITRANILLWLDENAGHVRKQSEIAELCHVSTVTVYNIAKEFVTKKCINDVLTRKKRSTPSIGVIPEDDVETRSSALA